MIDIIIPMYNARKHIERALISIAIQTIKKDINVILIDDCSKDDYKDIIDKYSKVLNIKYIRNKENMGSGLARQVGIDNSNSEYIVFLDADDWFNSSDSIEMLFNKIEEGYDLVESLSYNEQTNMEISNLGDLHGKIYRRKFIDKKQIKFNFTRYHEDNAFNSLVIVSDAKVSSIPKVTYVYHYNKESITNVGNEWERLEIYIHNMRYVVDFAIKNKCKTEKINEYLNTKYNYLSYVFLHSNESEKKELNNWLKKYNFDEII